jgi:type III restriction enzyme
VVEKSLFEPAIKGLTDTGLEEDFACYLDGKAALAWWHRNVARTQYGLQGWKRHKVYPDFVFARLDGEAGEGGAGRLVVMETKGLHLAGSDDTDYKRALLLRLTEAYRDERFTRAGSLELVGGTGSIETLVCDLIFDADWQGSLEARHFANSAAA